MTPIVFTEENEQLLANGQPVKRPTVLFYVSPDPLFDEQDVRILALGDESLVKRMLSTSDSNDKKLDRLFMRPLPSDATFLNQIQEHPKKLVYYFFFKQLFAWTHKKITKA